MAWQRNISRGVEINKFLKIFTKKMFDSPSKPYWGMGKGLNLLKKTWKLFPEIVLHGRKHRLKSKTL